MAAVGTWSVKDGRAKQLIVDGNAPHRYRIWSNPSSTNGVDLAIDKMRVSLPAGTCRDVCGKTIEIQLTGSHGHAQASGTYDNLD